MTQTETPVPVLDEHTAVAAAEADAVWAALLDEIADAFDGPAATTYARAVGCDPAEASGPRPLEPGSTVAGFRVTDAVPTEELTLEGRHRFSTYMMQVRLEALAPDSTLVRITSYARFPGPLGRIYRLLAVRTGIHVVAVSRLLDGVRRRSEGR